MWPVPAAAPLFTDKRPAGCTKLIWITCDCTDNHRGAGRRCLQTKETVDLEQRGYVLVTRAERNPGSVAPFPAALKLSWSEWFHSVVVYQRLRLNLTALKDAILQRHLQKHQKSQMTFLIAYSVCFKADERAVNTEPRELISASPIK